MPWLPTNHPPGSSGKITVLAERAADHQPLWNPFDAGFPDVVTSPAMFEPVSGDSQEALDENFKRFLEAVHGLQRLGSGNEICRGGCRETSRGLVSGSSDGDGLIGIGEEGPVEDLDLS